MMPQELIETSVFTKSKPFENVEKTVNEFLYQILIRSLRIMHSSNGWGDGTKKLISFTEYC